MPIEVVALVVLSVALALAAAVARDIGLRWVAYKQSTVTESREFAELRERDAIREKALAKLAADWKAAMDVERQRITDLESKRTAAAMSRSVENTTAWRK